MTPQHVISQLLESDTKYPENLDLLKKIIITAYLGRLRINGLSPDNKISLGNYLFDDERMIFDFTRLSDKKRAVFIKWLLDNHQNEKERGFLSGVHVNDYRGFTAEVQLSWWGRLLNWIFNDHTEHWKITDLSLSLSYQLTGIEMCHGKQGILIGFNQFAVPPTGTKYKDLNDPQNEPLGNTKRVFITDRLVDHLTDLNYKQLRFESVCKGPHPQSIDVVNTTTRLEEMHAYRKMQSFLDLKPWYIRVWRWFASWFVREDNAMTSELLPDNDLELLHKTETVEIFQRKKTQQIVVSEKRPDITNLVFCGGGAKIFAHVGVWKALNEAKIRPVQFAGSSAGAIMAMMCYLGYSADEISELFKNFKQEHLVQFDIDRNGLSDPHSLKTALDFAITNRLKQIVSKYHIPYPQGKITFATLESIRQQFPDCGIGKELIVTATNKNTGKTTYCSLMRTPNMEVSEAVKISSSFPILYRDTLLDGEKHNDGGVSSNFPTEVFLDDRSTFLESDGTNLKVLAVQFDNGTERTAIDRVMDKVYRENFILNWFYSLLTGVSDPASAWERDRLKLRQYALQTIIPDTDNISTTGFSVEEESQIKLIQNGYNATFDYLNARYKKKHDTYVNKELMYSTFTSLGDLLTYCCYRGDRQWFETVNNLIVQSSLPNRTALMKQSLELRQLYFSGRTSIDSPVDTPNATQQPVESRPLTFFGNAVSPHLNSEKRDDNHTILHTLYPIFLRLFPVLLKTSADMKLFDLARHSLSLHAPLTCLDHFNKMSGNVHIVLHIVIQLIKELKENPDEEVYSMLADMRHFLNSNVNFMKRDEYFGQWDLSIPQCLRILKLLKKEDHDTACKLLSFYRDKMEPMQIIKGGVFYDDFSDGGLEGNRLSFGA